MAVFLIPLIYWYYVIPQLLIRYVFVARWKKQDFRFATFDWTAAASTCGGELSPAQTVLSMTRPVRSVVRTQDISLRFTSKSLIMKMRPWLEQQLDWGTCKGLKWLCKETKTFIVTWLHASSRGFVETEHSSVFYQWAKYKGKIRSHSENKANFRSALRSLQGDVKELTDPKDKKGEHAKRTYRFIDQPFGKQEGKDHAMAVRTRKRKCKKRENAMASTVVKPESPLNVKVGELDSTPYLTSSASLSNAQDLPVPDTSSSHNVEPNFIVEHPVLESEVGPDGITRITLRTSGNTGIEPSQLTSEGPSPWISGSTTCGSLPSTSWSTTYESLPWTSGSTTCGSLPLTSGSTTYESLPLTSGSTTCESLPSTSESVGQYHQPQFLVMPKLMCGGEVRKKMEPKLQTIPLQGSHLCSTSGALLSEEEINPVETLDISELNRVAEGDIVFIGNMQTNSPWEELHFQTFDYENSSK